jgi:hypothetical protein
LVLCLGTALRRAVKNGKRLGLQSVCVNSISKLSPAGTAELRYIDLTLGFCLDHLNRKLEPASFFVDSGMPRPYKGLRNRPVSSQ